MSTTIKKFLDYSGLSKLVEQIGTALSKKQDKVYSGTCSTAGTVAAKVATVETFPTQTLTISNSTVTRPANGTVIRVYFSNSDGTKAATAVPTLNVNSTGDLPIYYNTATVATRTSAHTTILGSAGSYIWYMYDYTKGDYWIWLCHNVDNNTTYTNVSLGQGRTGAVSQSASTKAKTASLSSYALTTGGIVSVPFTNGNTHTTPTLNINSKGAKNISWRGSTTIPADLIKAGDEVTMIYSSSYHIISITRRTDPLVVTFTETSVGSNQGTTDYTFTEIKSAVDAGRTVTIIDDDGYVYHLQFIDGSEYYFECSDLQENDTVLTIYGQQGNNAVYRYSKSIKSPLVATYDGTTCDTSVADIYAAYTAKREVILHFWGGIELQLIAAADDIAMFSGLATSESTGDLQSITVTGIVEDNVDTWTFTPQLLQNKLSFDSAPTANSNNPVKSSGVKTAVDNAAKTVKHNSETGSTSLPILMSHQSSPSDGNNYEVGYDATDLAFNPLDNALRVGQVGTGVSRTTITEGGITLMETVAAQGVGGSTTTTTATIDSKNYSGTAAKATADASGNTITTTYATKTELNNAKPLRVVATQESDVITTNKTVSEIYTAYTNGRDVTCTFDNLELAPWGMHENSVGFYTFFGGSVVYIFGTVTDNTEEWTIDFYEYQEALTFDNAPTANSDNPVKSKGIKTAVDAAAKTVTINAESGSNSLPILLSHQQNPNTSTPTNYEAGFDSDGGLGFTPSSNTLRVGQAASGVSNTSITGGSITLKETTAGGIGTSPTTTTATLNSTDYSGKAARATADGSGNTITSTYATKAELNSSSTLIVPVEWDSSSESIICTAYSYSDIQQAYTNERPIIVKYNGYVYYLTGTDNGYFIFECRPFDESNGFYSMTISPSNVWSENLFYCNEQLTFDNSPTANSNNPVKSSGIKTYVDNSKTFFVPVIVSTNGNTTEYSSLTTFSQISAAAQAGRDVVAVCQHRYYPLTYIGDSAVTFDSVGSEEGVIYGFEVNSSNIWDRYEKTYQTTLVSGTNIKTIGPDSKSLLGSGSIILTGDDVYFTNNGEDCNYINDGDMVNECLISLDDAVNGKQSTLVSGTNIKTINNNSLLGSGSVTLTGNDIAYTGNEDYFLTSGDSIDENFDYLDHEINNRVPRIIVEQEQDLGEYLNTSEVGTIALAEHEGTFHILSEVGGVKSWHQIDVQSPNSISNVTSTATATGHTVTITQSNGNTTSFDVANGADGADGVSLGQIALVQTTGGSQESVMSQRAVTLETERLTANDLSSIENMAFSLPDGYLPCDYVQNGVTGNVGSLSTGIVPNGTGWRFVIELKVETTPPNMEGMFFGLWNDQARYSWLVGVNNSSTVVKFNTYARNQQTISNKNIYDWHVYDWNNSTCKVDNTSGSFVNSAADYTNTKEMQITANGLMSVKRIQAYNNNVLYADMIPCECSGIAGLYDIVRDVFYTSSDSTKPFVAVNVHTNPKDKLLNGEGLASLITQQTGDSTSKIMSQNAVTEYGRRITADDLAGTSNWIKTQLTALEWKLGNYINTSGGLSSNANCCVSPYLPISMVEHKGHSITFNYMYYIYSSWHVCFYDSNKTYISGLYYQGTSTNSRTVTISTSDSWDDVAYVRFTLGSAYLPQCYVYDNTTKEYLFRGKEYIKEICGNLNLTVGSLEQEIGDSVSTTMSQKAIINAINYNVNIEHGTGFTINSNATYRYLKLTSKATTLLNASDKMSFMFSTKGTGGQYDYRYFRFGNGSETANSVDGTNGVYLGWSYSKNLSANGISYTLNQSGNNYPTPDVWIVTWDRINGIVKFYDHTTLVNTLSGDSYKKDRFVNDNGLLAILGGDNNTRIYDIRLFDYDISYVMNNADISVEIKNLDGAGILTSQFLGNYKRANNDASFFSQTNNFGGGGYSATCTYSLDGDDYHIVVKDGVTTSQVCGGRPYYIGVDNRAQLEILEFEVVSGVIKTSYDGHNTTIFYKITDENGDEIVDYNNIGVGEYTLTRTSSAVGARLDFYKVSGDVEVIVNRVMQYRPISCVFHLRGDTMYNKKFYDDQTDSFITLYSDRTCTTEYTTHTMVKTPQRVIRQNISNADGLPHYAGEMAIASGKVYIGMPDYTWKQINNS